MQIAGIKTFVFKIILILLIDHIFEFRNAHSCVAFNFKGAVKVGTYHKTKRHDSSGISAIAKIELKQGSKNQLPVKCQIKTFLYILYTILYFQVGRFQFVLMNRLIDSYCIYIKSAKIG